MARPSLRLFWAAAVALPVVIGDGEIFLSSSSSTSSAPVSSDWTASNVTYDCNPYEGQEFLIFGNGNGITSGSCYASWDLHEIQLWDENGVQIQNLGAVSLTGSDNGYEAWKAVDGTESEFWAGDHDVGMSCSCWNSGKLDGQAIRIQLPGWKKVSKITLTQGGAGNAWAISEIRIHCGTSYQSNPLRSQISFGYTDIECNDNGCQTTRMDPAYYHTCNMVSRASSCCLIMTALLLGLGLS